MRAESETGALGIGQITSIVFEDMRIRRDKYLPILMRAVHSPEIDLIHSSELWTDVSRLSGDMSELEWNQLVDALQSRVENHDPYANILVSLLCFEVKYTSTTEKTAENFMNTLKSLDAEILLPDEPAEQRLTEAVRRYNGDRRHIK